MGRQVGRQVVDIHMGLEVGNRAGLVLQEVGQQVFRMRIDSLEGGNFYRCCLERLLCLVGLMIPYCLVLVLSCCLN